MSSLAPLKRNFGFMLGIACLGVLLLFGWQALDSSGRMAVPNGFVETTKPTQGKPILSPGAPMHHRLIVWAYSTVGPIFERFHKPNPKNWSFGPLGSGAPTRCSIHGLLNQCMQVTGTRYIIDRDIAAGSVDFGYTNTLDGGQWVAQFEDAVAHGKIEWWDPSKSGFRHDNPVLIRQNARTTIVVRSDKAALYQPAR